MMYSPPRHELRTWPEAFQAIWMRRKTAEFRKDDREFREGDELLLKEFDPEPGQYSGRMILVTITDIRRGPEFGIPVGYAMLSFRGEWRGSDRNAITLGD
jgi:ParB family transcriptional regulator, chromosome partitioning protein